MKEWFAKIQQKMEGMSPKEKRAYIRQYYWHYFLIGVIILELVILLIYHLIWEKKNLCFSVWR